MTLRESGNIETTPKKAGLIIKWTRGGGERAMIFVFLLLLEMVNALILFTCWNLFCLYK